MSDANAIRHAVVLTPAAATRWTRWGAMLVKLLNDRALPVDAALHRDLEEMLAATRELPAVVVDVPSLPTVEVAPPGWLSAERTVGEGLAPVSGRAVREAARRGRVRAVRCKGRILIDPESVKECMWRA